jgi:hypothetical protein
MSTTLIATTTGVRTLTARIGTASARNFSASRRGRETGIASSVSIRPRSMSSATRLAAL